MTEQTVDMQKKYEDIRNAVKTVSRALEDFMEAQQWVIELEEYEASGASAEDGVLSEDAIDELLADNDELLQIISMDEFERLW